MPSSNYVIVDRHDLGDALVLRDVGPWDRYMSVTNNAEGVIAELQRNGKLRRGQRLFYYDSEGALDELVIDSRGCFAGFRPGPRPEDSARNGGTR